MGILPEKNPAKILMIPHQPHRGIRVRALEMARYLATSRQQQVYVLTWQPAAPVQGLLPKIFTRFGEAFRSAGRSVQVTPDTECPNLHWVELPYLLSPNGLCQSFNQTQIGRFMANAGIDIVINASAYHFPVPKSRAYYVYDVVDDHLSRDSGPHWQATRQFTLAECQKADRVMAISHGLQEALKQHGMDDVLYVPNGVDMGSCAAANPAVLERLKQRHGLENQFVIAYVGNHGWWSGTAFLLRVFEKVHAEVPESKLLIVGPGEDADRCREQYHSDHVIFTGAVPPEEATAFFHLSDIGVLPFSLCPFTHNALPLKILEYGVAKKPMIASPLNELQQLQFPHVSLLPLAEDTWVNAILTYAKNPQPWQPAWNDTMARYDWPVVLKPLVDDLASALGGHRA